MAEAAERNEEGVVIKRADAPYRLGDRSPAWFKLKPDYAHVEQLDVLILGGYMGTGGRRGGLISEFLLGIAKASEPNKFLTFAKARPIARGG